MSFRKEFEKTAMVKKADGPMLNTGAANAVSQSFKGAVGGANTLNKIKGMFGFGTKAPGQYSNVGTGG